MTVQRHFDQELQSLKEKLISMAGLAESMVHKAVKSLIEMAGKGWPRARPFRRASCSDKVRVFEETDESVHVVAE